MGPVFSSAHRDDGLYSRMRDWRGQLENLLDKGKGDEQVALDRQGRVVTVLQPRSKGFMASAYNLVSYWTGYGTYDQDPNQNQNHESADDESQFSPKKVLDDIAIMQRSVTDLNALFALSDGDDYQKQKEDISLPVVRNCFRECDRLMASQAGQLIRTQDHLESLWADIQRGHANLEGSLHVTGDELQTCYSRFLATTRLEDDLFASYDKFNSFVSMWLDKKQGEITGMDPFDPALEGAYKQLRTQCRAFMEYSKQATQGKVHVLPEGFQPEALSVGDQVSRLSAESDIMSLVAASRAEVDLMNIPEEYPDARDMLTKDLEIAKQTFLDELKELPPEEVTASWYRGWEERLLKMRETMYYAVRSPDKEPPFYPARVGLQNRRIDCEPNSYAQAYSHLSCYDYFLHRLLPVAPMPEGPPPELDLRPLAPIEKEIATLRQQIGELANRLDNDPMYQIRNTHTERVANWVRQKREEFEKEKRELSSMKFSKQQKCEDLERRLKGEWKEKTRERQNQENARKKNLKLQEEQRFWSAKFKELRDPHYQGTNTLHRPDEGDIPRADGFPEGYGGLVPPGYRVNSVQLNPGIPETLEELQSSEAGVFVSGGHGHWTCLLTNDKGGIDHMNDSWVTRNYYHSKGDMLDRYLHKVLYKDQQLTAFFP